MKSTLADPGTPTPPAPPQVTPLANTLTGLVCNVCCDVGLSALCQIIGPLPFWTDCSADPMCPTRPVVVPLGTTASAAQVTPITNFAVGDTTATPITVTPVHISKAFHITSDQYNNCIRLEKIA